MDSPELETRYAVFDETNPNHVLKFVSLVESPAIGFLAVQFSKQEDREYKLAIHNEEQRIIFTPVLIPDQKIYREFDKKDESGKVIGVERFNMAFAADTIQTMALYFAQHGLSTKVDMQHSRNPIEGVTWFESAVLNPNRFCLAKGFERIPTGTWMLTGKVESDEVWAKIKAGEINGVSIDAVCGAESEPAHDPEVAEMARLLEQRLEKITQK